MDKNITSLKTFLSGKLKSAYIEYGNKNAQAARRSQEEFASLMKTVSMCNAINKILATEFHFERSNGFFYPSFYLEEFKNAIINTRLSRVFDVQLLGEAISIISYNQELCSSAEQKNDYDCKSVGDAEWNKVYTSALLPKSRVHRVLSSYGLKEPCDLQKFIEKIGPVGEHSHENLRRAYWCLLVLRDGIVLEDDVAIDTFIADKDSSTCFIEYFVVKVIGGSGKYRDMYVAISFVGGDPFSLRIKWCLSDKAENDREIADLRGHFCGNNIIESRSSNVDAVMNLSILGGTDDVQFDSIQFMAGLKAYRVCASIVEDLVPDNDFIDRLVITQIGDIRRIPFEILPWKDKTIGHFYSTIYIHGTSLLCDVDCVFSDVSTPINSLVIADCEFDSDINSSELLLIPGRANLFEPLFSSLEEGRFVNKLFNGDLLTGINANKNAVVDKLKEKPKIAHFATHAFYHDRVHRYSSDARCGDSIAIIDPYFANVSYTAIVLSGANSSVDDLGNVWANSNGLIETYDIMQLDLSRVLLVTLSCCESGFFSDEVDGNDSLAAAFMQSGTVCVVSTLWPVNDAYASKFICSFYSYLASKNSVSKSLRLARLDMLDEFPRVTTSFIATGKDFILGG